MPKKGGAFMKTVRDKVL